jgi:hypothetical protein
VGSCPAPNGVAVPERVTGRSSARTAHWFAEAVPAFSPQYSVNRRPSLSVDDAGLIHSHPSTLMHASCGSPLHLLGVFGPGAFAILGGGEDFSTFTTVGGAGISATVAGGGLTEPTGTCSGGSVAQAVTSNAASTIREK